jgi:hypothetical protein
VIGAHLRVRGVAVVEEQRVDLDLPARLVRCQNDDVSGQRQEAVV